MKNDPFLDSISDDAMFIKGEENIGVFNEMDCKMKFKT